MAVFTSEAVSADTVTSSIGVNTHLDFSNYGYTNLAITEAAINYLGLENLRDSADNPNTLGPTGSWQQVANATGAKFDDFITEGSPSADIRDLSYVNQLASQGILNFIEGGNENDNAYALSQGNSIAWTASFQQQVYAHRPRVGSSGHQHELRLGLDLDQQLAWRLRQGRRPVALRRLCERPHLPQCGPDTRRDDSAAQCGRATGRRLAICHHDRDWLE